MIIVIFSFVAVAVGFMVWLSPKQESNYSYGGYLPCGKLVIYGYDGIRWIKLEVVRNMCLTDVKPRDRWWQRKTEINTYTFRNIDDWLDAASCRSSQATRF